jgi:hypothetical protein
MTEMEWEWLRQLRKYEREGERVGQTVVLSWIPPALSNIINAICMRQCATLLARWTLQRCFLIQRNENTTAL